MSLRAAFAALVPENIKAIPLLQDTMDIFLTNLEENAAISIDVQNAFNVNVDLSASATPSPSLTANTKLRSALIQLYLESVYAVIKKAQSSEEIKNRLIAVHKNNSLLFSATPEQIIGKEQFLAIKFFNQSVGTISAINQAHHLANMLETGVNAKISPPKVTPQQPFNYLVESIITGLVYVSIVEPLAHPVGFTYMYTQLVELILQDTYGIHNEYTTKSIEIRGSDGTFEVFSPLSMVDLTANVSTNFLTKTNILTRQLFTQTEINTLVTLHPNKIVSQLTESFASNGRTIDILFTDGTAVVQHPDNVVPLLYVNYDVWITTPNGVITSYASTNNINYELFLDYSFNVVYDYYDTLVLGMGLNITSINDNTGVGGGITYLDSNGVSQPSNTSDHYIATSTEFVNESLTSSWVGYYWVSDLTTPPIYFVTNDPNGGLYAVCGL